MRKEGPKEKPKVRNFDEHMTEALAKVGKKHIPEPDEPFEADPPDHELAPEPGPNNPTVMSNDKGGGGPKSVRRGE